MLSKAFWIDAIERAIRTVAQVVLSLATVDGATPNLDANWQAIAVTGLLSGAFSLLMSIVASGTGNHTTAALVNPTKE